MDKQFLDLLVTTYEDSLDIELGACIECEHLVEPIDTNAQKITCKKCGKESVFGLQAIIERFGV